MQEELIRKEAQMKVENLKRDEQLAQMAANLQSMALSMQQKAASNSEEKE